MKILDFFSVSITASFNFYSSGQFSRLIQGLDISPKGIISAGFLTDWTPLFSQSYCYAV